jgi:SOS-response transcriptional repressor LexA
MNKNDTDLVCPACSGRFRAREFIELPAGDHSNRGLGSRPHFVRVLSDVEAGGFSNIDNFQREGAGEAVAVTVEVNRHTFALRVQGESMCGREGHSFPAGTIIVVEPELAAKPGDFVIALNDRKQATFKQLMLKEGELFLVPLNRRFKSIPLGDLKLIGVVRESIHRFR